MTANNTTERERALYALVTKLVAAILIMQNSPKHVSDKVASAVLQAARDAGVMVEA